jgi:hypothetical protein
MKKYIWSLTVLIFLFVISCKKSLYQELPIRKLVLDTSLIELDDSTYFSLGEGSIKNYGDNYLITDMNNHRIIHVDNNFHIIQIIGTKGRGPGDFLLPTGLLSYKDSICVIDAGNKRLCTFSKDENDYFTFKSQFKSEFQPGLNSMIERKCFFIDKSGTAFFNTFGENSPLGYINNDTLVHFGKYCNVSPKFNRNIRILLQDSLGFYSINTSEPLVEKFSYKGKTLDSLNLLSLDFLSETIKNNDKYYLKSENQNSTSYLFSDACLSNNKLFLLLTERVGEGGGSTNKILVLKDHENKLVPLELLELGDAWYTTFCVSTDNKYLIGSNGTTGELQRFKM